MEEWYPSIAYDSIITKNSKHTIDEWCWNHQQWMWKSSKSMYNYVVVAYLSIEGYHPEDRRDPIGIQLGKHYSCYPLFHRRGVQCHFRRSAPGLHTVPMKGAVGQCDSGH